MTSRCGVAGCSGEHCSLAPERLARRRGWLGKCRLSGRFSESTRSRLADVAVISVFGLISIKQPSEVSFIFWGLAV